MADKATVLPDPNEFKQPGTDLATVDQEALDKLAESAGKKNEAKARGIDRANNALTEAYANNWKEIDDAAKEVKAAEKILKKYKSALSLSYKQAKKDGCDIEVIKALRVLEDREPDALEQEHKDVAWLAALVKSPIAKVTTFASLLEEADMVNPYTQGYTSGKAGDDFNPPYTPGADDFVRYENGWRDGQKKLSAGMFTGKKKGGSAKPKTVAKKKTAAKKKK